MPEYSPFNTELDEKFPISGLVSEEDMRFFAGWRPDQTKEMLHWGRIFGGSPASNAEAEILMGRLLQAACIAGQWININCPASDVTTYRIRLPDGTEEIVMQNNRLEFRRGAEKLLSINFVTIEEDPQEGGEWVRPARELLRFFYSRITGKIPGEDDSEKEG